MVSSSAASRRGGFHPGDRLGAAVDVGAQPAPFGKRRDRGRVRGIRGGGDHLRLLELARELGDGVGRGPRRGEPFRRLRPLGGQSRQVLGERRMPAHRVVDLGDGGGTPADLVVGGTQPVDHGRPLAGRTAGGREVTQVLGVDAVDQQRLGPRQRDGLTRGDVERAGQRVASRQVDRGGGRGLQHPLGPPQLQIDGLVQQHPHPLVRLVTGELLAARSQHGQPRLSTACGTACGR